MEKIERLGKATDEERLKWKYVPEGEKLAVRYLKQDCNLVVELSEYEEAARRYVVAGASDILIRNINLPKDDLAKKNNRQVMDGLKNLKNTKVAVENAYSKIRRIFNHYAEQGEQQRKQAYESLKTEFEAKMQQAIQQQLGSLTRIKIDVEKQPQFQEEWRKIQTQLDSQYLKLLDEYKQELSGIA
jgi:polyribonucleotide nucleotidyltransferase